mgnify:CR=1 FL=1
MYSTVDVIGINVMSVKEGSVIFKRKCTYHTCATVPSDTSYDSIEGLWDSYPGNKSYIKLHFPKLENLFDSMALIPKIGIVFMISSKGEAMFMYKDSGGAVAEVVRVDAKKLNAKLNGAMSRAQLFKRLCLVWVFT